jgi:hypothetical protein
MEVAGSVSDCGGDRFPLYEQEEELDCPVCGHNCTHWNEAEVLFDHVGFALVASGEDDYGEVQTRALSAPSRKAIGAGVGHGYVGRRHVIIVRGYCEECNHSFALHLRQAKGTTYWQVVDHGQLTPREER